MISELVSPGSRVSSAVRGSMSPGDREKTLEQDCRSAGLDPDRFRFTHRKNDWMKPARLALEIIGTTEKTAIAESQAFPRREKWKYWKIMPEFQLFSRHSIVEWREIIGLELDLGWGPLNSWKKARIAELRAQLENRWICPERPGLPESHMKGAREWCEWRNAHEAEAIVREIAQTGGLAPPRGTDHIWTSCNADGPPVRTIMMDPCFFEYLETFDSLKGLKPGSLHANIRQKVCNAAERFLPRDPPRDRKPRN